MAPDAHSAALWDTVAARYDSLRPDQGLTDPEIRAAWSELLAGLLPNRACTILDAGCGTGSLSVLLAAGGHAVTGIDFSPAMVAVARAKPEAASGSVRFIVGDASAPDVPPGRFDAVICRQTLWALPDRGKALANWAELLVPGGKVVLIEGRFASGRGMSEAEIRAVLPDTLIVTEVSDLSKRERLWGGPIPDQRLLIVAAPSRSNEDEA